MSENYSQEQPKGRPTLPPERVARLNELLEQGKSPKFIKAEMNLPLSTIYIYRRVWKQGKEGVA